MVSMTSLKPGYTALVVGASGGIGSAIAGLLEADKRCVDVDQLDRQHFPEFDLTDEHSIEAAVEKLIGRTQRKYDLIFVATGALQIAGMPPEKSIGRVRQQAMQAQFAVNAIGPALLLKYLSPALNREHKSVFACLSARVGSIGDNHLGGWISYRSAKAALNQIIRTASIEIARKNPKNVCVALHPGTVQTDLSRGFMGSRHAQSPEEAAQNLLRTLDGLTAGETGGFFAYDGSEIEW